MKSIVKSLFLIIAMSLLLISCSAEKPTGKAIDISKVSEQTIAVLTKQEKTKVSATKASSTKKDVISTPKTEPEEDPVEMTYVLNTNTKKFHYEECKAVSSIFDKNRKSYTGTREGAIKKGYVPCKICDP